MKRTPPAPSADDEKMLKDMLDAKLIVKINPDLNEAWVNPLTWATATYDQKYGMCRFLAEYCGKKKGAGSNWIEIYDNYSGKKLAKYSKTFGFNVY